MKIALICGGGILPQHVIAALIRGGKPFIVICLKREAASKLKVPPGIVSESLGWGQIGRFFDLLKQEGCTHVLAVGSVMERPDFSVLKLDFGGLKVLPELIKIVKGGDDTVLGKVARFFEKRGLGVLSVLDVVPEIICPEGMPTRSRPTKEAEKDISLAVKAARSAGKLDMGQGAVAAGGRVLALEGPEGTDQMLERVAQLRREGRARWKARQGVLVKCAKPLQDLRFDVPVIGPGTIAKVKKAGLAGLALQAHKVLLLEKEKLLQLANEEKLFIKGFDVEKPKPPLPLS